MKIILMILMALMTVAQAAEVSKELSEAASKELYFKLKVKIEDHDDILNKNVVLPLSGIKFSCEKWVVDKAYQCTVTASAKDISIQGEEAKGLYKILRVDVEDQDDIQGKYLKVDGLEIRCEYWVVDKEYVCSVKF